MNEFTMIFRIIISALLGGIIGFEREVHGRPAGIRTQMLVCLGSTVFMIISILIAVKYKEFGPVDPTRIAAGVVTGIGFLGAGAIIRAGRSIHGLTTAASIWAVSAIGMAIGAGLYVIGFLATGVVIAVLFLSKVERQLELKKDDDGEKKK